MSETNNEAAKTAFVHYQPSERRIFHYFDGQKIIKADPLELYKALLKVGPDLSIDYKVASSTLVASTESIKAHDGMVAKARVIFKVKPIEEDGLTQTEVLDLLNTFMAYCDELKKKAKSMPTSSTPTDPSSTLPILPTRSSSGSGSTGDAVSTVKQESLPSGSE